MNWVDRVCSERDWVEARRRWIVFDIVFAAFALPGDCSRIADSEHVF
jgi:hypothetical protein